MQKSGCNWNEQTGGGVGGGNTASTLIFPRFYFYAFTSAGVTNIVKRWKVCVSGLFE